MRKENLRNEVVSGKCCLTEGSSFTATEWSKFLAILFSAIFLLFLFLCQEKKNKISFVSFLVPRKEN
jgi:hypothetical protein